MTIIKMAPTCHSDNVGENCEKGMCTDCQTMNFDDSTETEQATRQLENLNKEFFIEDFNMKAAEYLPDVQNCIEIKSSNIITISNGDYIINDDISDQFNLNDNYGSKSDSYTTLNYEIYEDALNARNSTDNFTIEQEQFESNSQSIQSQQMEICLNASENALNTIVHQGTTEQASMDVEEMENVSFFKNNFIITLPKNNKNIEDTLSMWNANTDISKSLDDQLIDNIISLKSSDGPGRTVITALNETSNFSINEESSNSTSSSSDKFMNDHLRGTSTLLSPKSDSDVEQSEADLTSLNWLQNYTNIMSVPNLPTPPVSPKPKSRGRGTSISNHLDPKVDAPKTTDLTIDITYYKKTGDKKPPFSYATLICMAMGRNGNRMTLSAIYHWIRENFLYYRKAHPSWQNSIRHNLSLNKCFVKQARSKEEPGKGGFWKLDLERLEESRKSKRRSSLTVRTPKNGQPVKPTKVLKKPKRYRPASAPSERKHNILSNISICGATDIENVEEAARANTKNKKTNQNILRTYQKSKKNSSSESDFNEKSIVCQETSVIEENTDNIISIVMEEKLNEEVSQNLQRTNQILPPSMPHEPPIAEPVAPPIVGEEELTGLLLATNGWDECQLDMLDSILDSL